MIEKTYLKETHSRLWCTHEGNTKNWQI